MILRWLGHSAFLLVDGDGRRVITDPYRPSRFSPLRYGPIREAADVVTVSHEHSDHNFVASVSGAPQVVREPGFHEAGGLQFHGVASYHDNRGGRRRGPNTAFVFSLDGLRVCHLGDLGHELDESQLQALAPVDVILLPVGGLFTLSPEAAGRVADALNARVTVPMHYRNRRCWLPFAGVGAFLRDRPQVRRLDVSEVEVTPETLPAEPQTWVLQPVL